MMIKVGDEYLDFTGTIELQRQVMNIDNLESVGNFSYSFNPDDTQKNRRLLNLLNINSSKSAYKPIEAQLLTDSGIPLHYGFIIVSDRISLECSFISGNNNFFNSIQGNINDVDVDDLDILISENAIVDSWSSSTGLVFPLVDRGGLSNRKTAFLKLRSRFGRLDLSDFQPFIYVKDVINRLMTKSGLKIEGDLINDATYNSLITTNNNLDFTNKVFKESEVNIGKSAPQSISDAGYTKVIFDDVTSTQYYNSPNGNFDLINSRWSIGYDSRIQLTFNIDLSDSTKIVNFEARRNGINIGNTNFKGSHIEFIEDPEAPVHASPGDYYELWAKVDASTPGSMSITNGSFKAEVLDSMMVFARTLLPEQSSRDFIKDIFRMFNVVCSFDSFSKTIHTRFFSRIKDQPEQDISKYLDSYESEDGLDLLSDYAQQNTLLYNLDEIAEIDKYNSENSIPFAGGSIDIDNSFLDESDNLFTLGFTAPYSKLYPTYGLQLIRLNYLEFISNDEAGDPDVRSITSVSDSGGKPQFNPSGSWSPSTITTNDSFIGTATGLQTVATMSLISNSNQIIAINIPHVSLPVPIRFSQQTATGPLLSEFIIRNSQFTEPAYNGDWEHASSTVDTRTEASVAAFVKYSDGTDMDLVKQGLSFGEIQNKDSLSLSSTYYQSTERILNDPIKIKARFYMPENIYRGLDFLRPFRLKTPEFNALFYLDKEIGYNSSSEFFVMELIKLSV